jgi:hypothetical protein
LIGQKDNVDGDDFISISQSVTAASAHRIDDNSKNNAQQ